MTARTGASMTRDEVLRFCNAVDCALNRALNLSRYGAEFRGIADTIELLLPRVRDALITPEQVVGNTLQPAPAEELPELSAECNARINKYIWRDEASPKDFHDVVRAILAEARRIAREVCREEIAAAKVSLCHHRRGPNDSLDYITGKLKPGGKDD